MWPHAGTMPSDDLVVVLVHGTKPRLFGRDLMAPPTWTKPDSPFRNILAGTLEEQALFVEFDWSGANTHAARLSAAARLADLLRQLRRDHPAARLVLIAHSHGGNVVLYAMRQLAPADGAERHPVDGLVCLGTPFLRATLGDVKVVFERLHISLYWGVLTGLLALTLSLAFVLEQTDLTAVKVAFVAGILAFISWKFGGKWLLKRYFTVPRAEAFMLKARGLASSVDCRPAFNCPPMFVVKSERDEAKLWLTLMDRSASLLSGERLLQWTSRSILAGAALFDWLESRGVPWALSVVVTILLWALGTADSVDVKPFVYAFVFAPAAALIFLSLSHSLLFVAVVLVLRGSTLAFGQSLFLSLVASVGPNDHIADDNHPGVRVMTLKLPPRVFHHASLYIDPPTIKAIGAWVDAAHDTSTVPIN
jgi:hypothetical protein